MKSLFTILLAFLVIPAAIAGQKVTVTLTNDFTASHLVGCTGFVSSDFLEDTTINCGQQSTVTRTYYHGPKEITAKISLTPFGVRQVDIADCNNIFTSYRYGRIYAYGNSHPIITTSDHLNINVKMDANYKLHCSIEQ